MANCVSMMTKILRKRHDLRTHKQQAVSDWLNPPLFGDHSELQPISNVWANIDDGHMGTLKQIG